MKIFAIVTMLVLGMLSAASAAVKDSGIMPQLYPENMVSLDISPQMVTSLVVYIYDDATGNPPLELPMTSRFTLLPGQGFNYKFTDASGTYWQLVTPSTSVGVGLSVDCGNAGGCKYFRPLIRK